MSGPSADVQRSESSHVFAIVVGTNQRAWLKECFETLVACEGVRLSVVYVDNASKDGSVDFVRSHWPSVRVIPAPVNLGFAGASNLGFREGLTRGADAVFLVNPDTRTPADLPARLSAFLDANPVFGIAGPLQTVYGGPPDRLNAWSEHAIDNGERHEFHHWAPWLPGYGCRDGERWSGVLQHSYVQGAALMIRADVLREVGFLKTYYHSFYEEVDLCRRVRWAGHRVGLLLDATIEHHGETDGGDSAYRNYHMTRNRYVYLATDPTIPRLTAVWLGVRWFANDVWTQRRRPVGSVTDLSEFVAVWRWLISHTALLRRERRDAGADRTARGGQTTSPSRRTNRWRRMVS